MADGPTFLHSRDDKLQLLHRIGLFANLSPRELLLIADSTRLVEFKKDEVVYREGEPAKAFYVVISGRLRLAISGLAGEQTVTYLHRGDSFGESALLTGEAHSATVVAQNDTLVLTLSKDEFEVIIDRIPSLVLYLSRVLSRRLRRRGGRASEFAEATIITMYSAVPGVGRTAFALSLALSLKRETHQPSVIVDMSLGGGHVSRFLGLPESTPLMARPADRILDQELLHEAIQQHASGLNVLNVGHREDSRTANLIAPLLTSLADSFRFVIVDLPTQVDDMVLQALVQSDRVFLISDDEEEHLLRTRALRRRLDDLMQQVDHKVRILLNLVHHDHASPGLADEERTLGHPIAHVLPRLVEQGAELAFERLLAVLARDEISYTHVVRRIAREVGQVLVGVALGSGAALGLAHIGVLKVLERERIPVDMIAGASIGALIASFWSTGHSAQELERIALHFHSRLQMGLELLDPPLLPWRGMFPGHGITKFLRSVLKNQTFDETSIPLRIVATNPYTRERLVFREGMITDAVRASVSIPGIFLPVIRQGNVLLDGGVSSPIPVGVLREEGVQRVIAVNVFPTSEEMQQLQIATRRAKAARMEAIATRPFPVRLWHWLKDQSAEIFSPVVTQVIMHSMQTMEYRIGEIECEDADVVIRSSTPGANWDDFYQAERLIKRGEEAAEQALPQLTQLLQT